MVRQVNNCVGCEVCMQCGADHQIELVCDECGFEADKLYEYDNEQMCENCLLKFVPEVDIYDN